MATNPSPSQLSPSQIAKKIFDGTNDAIRISLGDATGIAIELSAADGDSVESQVRSVSQKASLTSSSTGVIIAAFDAKDLKRFNIYSKSTSAVVGPQVLTLEFSPHDSDNIWIASSLTITPSTTNGTVVSGTAIDVLARRVRVSTAGALTSGTVDVYLVGQGA